MRADVKQFLQRIVIHMSGTKTLTMDVQHFLSVGHITNFRRLAGPHEKFSFFMYTMNQSVWEKWESGKNQSVGKGHSKWLDGLWPAGRLLHTPALNQIM